MLPQLVNSGVFTQQNLKAINANFALLAGMAGGGVFGESFYVDPVDGTDNNNGSSDFPVASINKAIALAVSGRGDTIFITAGEYDENVVLDKDYVALVGGQNGGYARPDIGPATSGSAAVTVTGQGCILQHLRIFSDTGDALVQKGNGFIITDCVLDGDGTALKAGLRLVGDATNTHLTASEGRVTGNYFRGSAIGICFDTAPIPNGVGSTDNQIDNNRFSANTLDIALASNGGVTYSVQLTEIGPNNQFLDKNKATYIDMVTNAGGGAAAQTGAINGNYFASDVITAGATVKMQATGFTFTGNYYTVGIKDGSALD